MARRTKILVVEDNLGTRSTLEYALEFEGYDVRGVSDDDEVAGALLDHRPHLVILDVMMPGKDGFEVLRDIRSDADTKELPVLMLTALDDPASTWKGWSGGCDYYMNKPFDTSDLLGIVAKLVRGEAA